MHLDKCHPEELQIQVERLAERSLTHGTERDPDEAYWTADDTIREAYRLPAHSAPEDRARGFAGWLSSRVDLVRSGWRKLVEHSRALATRIGDPMAKEEAARQAQDEPPPGERWRALGRLERELEADEAQQPPRKPRGFTR